MFEFRLQPHPSRIRVHGQLVPHITDMQMIQVNEGQRWMQCGYCGCEPGRPISLTAHYPQVFVDAVQMFVDSAVGKAAGVTQPPPPPKQKQQSSILVDERGQPIDDDEEEDEDE